MTLVQEFMLQRPVVNPLGEEIWEEFGPNIDLARLKPGTSSEKRSNELTKEYYAIIHGHPTLVVDEETIWLTRSDVVVTFPKEVHQIFNDTTEDVVFVVKTDICWPIQGQPIL